MLSPCMSCLATNNVSSNRRDGGWQCGAQIRPDPTLRPRRRGCGVGGLDLTQEPTGSLRARAILIRQALERALIVLALTLCPVYHWTSQWRAPLLGEGLGEAERGTGGGGGSGLSALYRAPIKGSLSERLRGPKKGMFILRLGDGLSQGKEWTARGESCLPVRLGMSSSNWPLKPQTVRARKMEEGSQSSQHEITSKLQMGNEKAGKKKQKQQLITTVVKLRCCIILLNKLKRRYFYEFSPLRGGLGRASWTFRSRG